MPRPYVFSVPTVLYHAIEGRRVFGVGETDPGNAWSENEGGDAVGAATTTQALKDMIALQEQIEGRDRLLVAKDLDLLNLSAERDAANARSLEAEQAKVNAEAALADAERRLQVSEDARNEAESAVARFDGDSDGRIGGRRAKTAKGDASASA